MSFGGVISKGVIITPQRSWTFVLGRGRITPKSLLSFNVFKT